MDVARAPWSLFCFRLYKQRQTQSTKPKGSSALLWLPKALWSSFCFRLYKQTQTYICVCIYTHSCVCFFVVFLFCFFVCLFFKIYIHSYFHLIYISHADSHVPQILTHSPPHFCFPFDGVYVQGTNTSYIKPQDIHLHRGYTSGGVYVPSIYSHARCELP